MSGLVGQSPALSGKPSRHIGHEEKMLDGMILTVSPGATASGSPVAVLLVYCA